MKKKCFHCFRLSHEKPKCPLLQGLRSQGKGVVVRQKETEVHSSGGRGHHNDLVEKLMPLMAPTIPPGFKPSPNIVAPEVFEQMRIYMDCVDPEERRLREVKMRKTLQELSSDPIAQRSCLQLERAPLVLSAINTEKEEKFKRTLHFKTKVETFYRYTNNFYRKDTFYRFELYVFKFELFFKTFFNSFFEFLF